jgi:molecular chaperone DnaK
LKADTTASIFSNEEDSMSLSSKVSRLSLGRRFPCQFQQHREFVIGKVLALGAVALVGRLAYNHYQEILRKGRSYVDKTQELEAPLDQQDSFGIDIGSSFSRIAIRQADKSEPFMALNRDGKRSIPSVVRFPRGINISEESLIDINHGSYVVGAAASLSRFTESDTTFTGSSLISPVDCLESAPQLLEIEKSFIFELLAKDLKVSVQSKYERPEVVPAFVSVPNFFTATQTALLISACRDAGLNCVASIPDSISAILGSIELGLYTPSSSIQSKYRETVCVVDVGGSFVQMSILSMKNRANSIPTILAQKTLTNNGGNFFDDALVAHLMAQYSKLNGGVALSVDRRNKQLLYDAAELAKIDLSTAKSTKVQIPFISSSDEGLKHLECEVSKAELEILLDDLMRDIQSSFKDLLVQTSKQVTPISANVGEQGTEVKGLGINLAAVLLVGGGARMPLIKSRMTDVIGDVPLLISQRPEEVVVLGASAFQKIAEY